MEPVTLTTDRLLLRTVGTDDTHAVYMACQDPEIQRWTTVPSPYLPEHAHGFTEQLVPGGWADGSMFTFGFLLGGTAGSGEPAGAGAGPVGGEPVGAGPVGGEPVGADPVGGELVGMMGLTVRGPGVAEIGYWTVKEHRGRGYTTEAALAVCRWAFTAVSMDRVEWRAEVGNGPSRAVAERAGFTMEGTLRSALVNHGVRRDTWVGSLLPSDLGLPSAQPYLPARER